MRNATPGENEVRVSRLYCADFRRVRGFGSAGTTSSIIAPGSAGLDSRRLLVAFRLFCFMLLNFNSWIGAAIDYDRSTGVSHGTPSGSAWGMELKPQSGKEGREL